MALLALGWWCQQSQYSGIYPHHAAGRHPCPFPADAKSNWLNQSNSNFDRLIPLADRQTKLAKTVEDERAVFGLLSVGISTNRDEWVYDFDRSTLAGKVKFFCETYENEGKRYIEEKPNPSSLTGWVTKSIKWTSELETHLVRGNPLILDLKNIEPILHRPFVHKHGYYAPLITHRRYQMPQVFPHGLKWDNKVICFPGNAPSGGFQILATNVVYSHDLLKTTQCLPLYRYTGNGERVSNITQWGIDHINGHYRQEWGDDFQALAAHQRAIGHTFEFTLSLPEPSNTGGRPPPRRRNLERRTGNPPPPPAVIQRRPDSRRAVPNQPQPRKRHAEPTTGRGHRRRSVRSCNAASPRTKEIRSSSSASVSYAEIRPSRTRPGARPAPSSIGNTAGRPRKGPSMRRTRPPARLASSDDTPAQKPSPARD